MHAAHTTSRWLLSKTFAILIFLWFRCELGDVEFVAPKHTLRFILGIWSHLEQILEQVIVLLVFYIFNFLVFKENLINEIVDHYRFRLLLVLGLVSYLLVVHFVITAFVTFNFGDIQSFNLPLHYHFFLLLFLRFQFGGRQRDDFMLESLF